MCFHGNRRKEGRARKSVCVCVCVYMGIPKTEKEKRLGKKQGEVESDLSIKVCLRRLCSFSVCNLRP